MSQPIVLRQAWCWKTACSLRLTGSRTTHKTKLVILWYCSSLMRYFQSQGVQSKLFLLFMQSFMHKVTFLSMWFETLSHTILLPWRICRNLQTNHACGNPMVSQQVGLCHVENISQLSGDHMASGNCVLWQFVTLFYGNSQHDLTYLAKSICSE